MNPSAETPVRRRCRSLTVKGFQCRQSALDGQDLCVAHSRHRSPVCPRGPQVTIPLIEDLDAIQLLATQVAQGLLAETLDPARAGKILYACQVAALTIPRPGRLRPKEAQPSRLQPVTEVVEGPQGELLGPDEAWVDPNADPSDEAWRKYLEIRYDRCRYGAGFCNGPYMINCCHACRMERLTDIAKAESQRSIFASDKKSEVILAEMIDRFRREAEEAAAAQTAEAEAAANPETEAPQPEPPQPEALQPETPQPATIATLNAGGQPVRRPARCMARPCPYRGCSYCVVNPANRAELIRISDLIQAHREGGYLAQPLTPDRRPPQPPPAPRPAASSGDTRG